MNIYTRGPEIDVSCEAATTGEQARRGRVGVDGTREEARQRRAGEAQEFPDPRVEIDACAPCHARRQTVLSRLLPAKIS